VNENDDTKSKEHAGYLSIGTVAKLTGISVHTLRAWEKRYQVVDIVRSQTGRRLYAQEDVQRLRLLRKLTNLGHSISNIANLDNPQLDQMLDLQDEPSFNTRSSAQALEVCLFNEKGVESFSLPSPIKDKVNITLETSDVSKMRAATEKKPHIAVVMIFTTLQKHHLKLLRAMNETDDSKRIFVVFTFAQRDFIEELNTIGIQMIRGPISYHQLFERVFELMRPEQVAAQGASVSIAMAEAPPHLFSRRQLEKVAMVNTAVECECPYHIGALIRSLTQFEGYAQQCLTSKGAEAQIHNELYKHTAQARAIMERALDLVLKAENIDLNHIDPCDENVG